MCFFYDEYGETKLLTVVFLFVKRGQAALGRPKKSYLGDLGQAWHDIIFFLKKKIMGLWFFIFLEDTWFELNIVLVGTKVTLCFVALGSR